MTKTERIINKFGGLTPAARALKHKHVTTVQGWLERDNIPKEQIPAVLKAGKKLGLNIKLEDFFNGV